MKVLIAPNAFKGSLSPLAAAEIIETAVKKTLKAETAIMPISDGGDGLSEVLLHHLGGKCVKKTVYDALFNKVKAKYCILKNKTAVIEVAEACGLKKLKLKKLKPMQASSYGAGQLILDALNKNIKTIYIGLGGSASNDGGTGLARALGVKFLDKNKKELDFGIEPLKKLHSINMDDVDTRIKKTKFYAISDVENPLLGRNGSAYVYGAQKGASPAQIKIMAKALGQYAKIIKQDLNKDVRYLKGAAAAGGICSGVYSFLNAEIVKGADFVLNIIKAKEHIKKSDLIITGEGCLDKQTFYGKAPYALSKLAKKHSKPVLFITGTNKIKNAVFLKHKGISAVSEMVKNKTHLKKCISNPKKYLGKAVICGLKDLF